MQRLLSLVLLIILSVCGHAQFAYRMHANILTQTRLPDSTFQVSKGKINYDINHRKIIFDFSFPEKEKVILFDTLMYRYVNDTLVEETRNYLVPEQSFFHYILTENISNYGYDQTVFKTGGTERQGDLVITTWLAPEQLHEIVTKVLVATRRKQLYSVSILGPDEEVINRQILKNYELIGGIEVPHEILMATYLDRGTTYQIIKLDNVILNEPGNDQKYNHAF
jgi:hypothetical protein